MDLDVLYFGGEMRSCVDILLYLVPVEVIDPCFVELLCPCIWRSILCFRVRDYLFGRKSGVLEFSFQTIYLFLGDVYAEGFNGLGRHVWGRGGKDVYVLEIPTKKASD